MTLDILGHSGEIVLARDLMSQGPRHPVTEPAEDDSSCVWSAAAPRIPPRTTLRVRWGITEIELAWHVAAYVSGSWLDGELTWHHTWSDNLHRQDKSAPDGMLAAAGWWPFTSGCDWLRRRERMCGYFWAPVNPSPRSDTAARRYAARGRLCLPRWLTGVNLSASALRARLTNVRMCKNSSVAPVRIHPHRKQRQHSRFSSTNCWALVPFYDFTLFTLSPINNLCLFHQ